MKINSRAKGRRGQLAARNLLNDRGWGVVELNSGTASEDLIATDQDGIVWSVEVKNTVSITKDHRLQAQKQAKERRSPWMLMSHIPGTRSWLIQRQNAKPCVWHEKDSDDDPLS